MVLLWPCFPGAFIWGPGDMSIASWHCACVPLMQHRGHHIASQSFLIHITAVSAPVQNLTVFCLSHLRARALAHCMYFQSGVAWTDMWPLVAAMMDAFECLILGIPLTKEILHCCWPNFASDWNLCIRHLYNTSTLHRVAGPGFWAQLTLHISWTEWLPQNEQ